MPQSDSPSPPDRPAPPGPTPHPPILVFISPTLHLKPRLRNPSPAMCLRFARGELEEAVYTHDRYLNDYRMAHRRIHNAYALKRAIDTARHHRPASFYDHALRAYQCQRAKASNAMSMARENVKVLREDIERIKETVRVIASG